MRQVTAYRMFKSKMRKECVSDGQTLLFVLEIIYILILDFFIVTISLYSMLKLKAQLNIYHTSLH